jgi:hypothetical protein
MKKSFSTNIFSKPDYLSKKRGKEHIAIIGAFLVGIIVLIWSVVSFLNIPGVTSREATLILAFENEGKGRMFTGEVVDGMTILEALIASSEAGQIELKYSLDPNNGAKITGLNGYYSDSSGKNMVINLNENRISEREIYKVVIKPGDKIEIQLE